MFLEFKKFVTRGNVIDLAVGIVIGAAFNAIVQSLVNDLIMPFIGYFTSGINFSDLKFILAEAIMENGEVVTPEVAVTYGNFIQVIIQFLIISLVIFIVVKGINRMRDRVEARRKIEADVTAAPAATPADIALLTEIRDLLKR